MVRDEDGEGQLWLEGHSRAQLRAHSKQLEDDQDAWLFVLTPDPVRPAWFASLDGVHASVRSKILWFSFRQLADAIEVVSSDAARLIGEQSRFLLMELTSLYDAEGLLTNDDTVVVAARSAWPEYRTTRAYVCQPDRAFREGLTHLGFYAEGAIQPLVPRIREHRSSVLFTHAEASARRSNGERELGDLIDALLEDGSRTDGEHYGVLLLSGPQDPDTVVLANPIENDTVSAAGKK